MTESEQHVTKIVGSGAPVEDATSVETSSGDLEYDEVHRFLGEMSTGQDDSLTPQQGSGGTAGGDV
jgi:hypothetical protein